MPSAAHKLVAKPVSAKPGIAKPRRKIFHAAMLVTRAEEWWVEAATAAEARALLAAGIGQHAGLGERVHAEVDEMIEDAG
jgi:hypothetical protein